MERFVVRELLVTLFAPLREPAVLFTGWALDAGRLSSGRLRVELAAHGGVSLSNGWFCLGFASWTEEASSMDSLFRIDTDGRMVLAKRDCGGHDVLDAVERANPASLRNTCLLPYSSRYLEALVRTFSLSAGSL